MESTKPVAVPPLKATHSHLSFCLRSTSSLLGPTAAAAQASISGENDSSEFSGLEGVHAGDQESTARAGGEKGGAVAGVEDENVRQRDPATSLFSASSIKTDNTGKMDLADARWRAMNGEKKWLDVNEAEREEILSSAASGSDRSTMNTRHSETGYEGESLSGCDDDDEGTLDLVEGALLRMLSRGGRPKHHQTSNPEFNGLEGSSGQHTAPSAQNREVGSSNAVKDTELLAKLLDQVHHLKKQRDLRSGEPRSSTHVEDRASRHRNVGREKKTSSRNDELRMTLEAASEAAKAAADAAQAAAISVAKNTNAIELLTRALNSSPGSNVTQSQGQESGRKSKSTVEETSGSDKEDKTQKAIVKQNKRTHWILGFMVVTTIAWRFGVVKMVNRVRSKINNPMDYVGGLLGGGKDSDSDEEEEEEPQKKNILEQIKLPSLLAGDAADNTESKPEKDAWKLVEPQAEVAKEKETVFNFGTLQTYFKLLDTATFQKNQECREACGGQGLKTDNRIGQLKMEYDVQLTFEGDNNVLMQQVSKELLNEYFAAARKGRPIKGLGLEFMNGHRPIIPQEPSRLVLRDHTFQMSILQLRVRGLLELLVAEVKGHMSTGISEPEGLNSSYLLAEDLGKAFSALFILDSFLRVEQQTEGLMKELLGLLRTLYVMSVADEETSFLRYGYLSPKQAQLVHREVATLCTELRPQALNLVDAFGIPQPFLGAIGFDWVEYNSWKNVL